MVSIDEDLVGKLNSSPAFNFKALASALKKRTMKKTDYEDFLLVLETIVGKSFGEAYGFTHLIPYEFAPTGPNLGDLLKFNYPGLIVGPNDGKPNLSSVNVQERVFDCVGQIGHPQAPNDGSLVIVLPTHLQCAALYGMYYEKLFGYKVEIVEACERDIIRGGSENQPHHFRMLDLINL